MTKGQRKSEKIKWLRRHRAYERKNNDNFTRSIKKMVLEIPFDKLNLETYQEGVVESLKSEKKMYQAVLDIHLNSGRKEYIFHREQIDRIKKELRVKRSPLLNYELIKLIAQNLLVTGGLRIVSMQNTLARFVIGIIAEFLLDEDKTYQQAVNFLMKMAQEKGFYRNQINRIVRTETTQASQFTALEAMDDPDIYLDKVWLSIDDDRTRDGDKGAIYNHLDMDGIVKKPEEFFQIEMFGGGTEPLLYPGDPNGSAGNVINCRCGITQLPRLDTNGRPILKK